MEYWISRGQLGDILLLLADFPLTEYWNIMEYQNTGILNIRGSEEWYSLIFPSSRIPEYHRILEYWISRGQLSDILLPLRLSRISEYWNIAWDSEYRISDDGIACRQGSRIPECFFVIKYWISFAVLPARCARQALANSKHWNIEYWGVVEQSCMLE